MTDPNAKYAVGYGKPPIEHRFRPGISGNPRGRRANGLRPNRASDLTDACVKAFLKPQKVVIDGKEQQMPAYEAVGEMLVREIFRAPARMKIAYLQLLDKIGVLERLRSACEQVTSDEYETLFSEEDRRLLEVVQKAMLGAS